MDEHLTKTKIKAAALKLFVERGVAETTTRDLAQAAGIAEGTIYRHYKAKEDLARDLFREYYADFASRILAAQENKTGIKAKITAIVRGACKLFDNDPNLYRFLLLIQHEAISRLPKGAASPLTAMKSIVTEGIKSGEVKIADAQLGAAMVLGILVQPALAIVHGNLKGPMSRHCDEIAYACVRILT